MKEGGGDVRVRGKKTHGWQPFTSFAPRDGKLQELYDWNGTVLAGDRFVTEYVSRRLVHRPRLLFRLVRWLKDLRGNIR